MLQAAREAPRDMMCHDPAQNHHADTNQPQNHPRWAQIIRAEHDVVHVSPEPRQHHERHMHDDETDKSDEVQKMNRSGGLPTPKSFTYPGQRFTRAGDMAMPVRIASGAIMKMVAK